eukprot:1156398-Pelagomonas_calceolata.AAC.7
MAPQHPASAAMPHHASKYRQTLVKKKKKGKKGRLRKPGPAVCMKESQCVTSHFSEYSTAPKRHACEYLLAMVSVVP